MRRISAARTQWVRNFCLGVQIQRVWGQKTCHWEGGSSDRNSGDFHRRLSLFVLYTIITIELLVLKVINGTLLGQKSPET